MIDIEYKYVLIVPHGALKLSVNALEVEEVEKLRGLMNGILNGADIPKEWKESRVKLLHKGERTDKLKNYRPIVIINVTCKLCMLMVRERLDLLLLVRLITRISQPAE